MSDDWTVRALCRERGIDTNEFFPTGRYVIPEWIVWMCARCPVREPCLADAVDNATRLGIWAATSPRQRAVIRSQAHRDRLAARQRIEVREGHSDGVVVRDDRGRAVAGFYQPSEAL